MESVDHTPDCPMRLFFYELQMAVKALLKQINIPLHQVLVFTIIFIFFLWLMETALWCKTQEAKNYTYIHFVHWLNAALHIHAHFQSDAYTRTLGTLPHLYASSPMLTSPKVPRPHFIVVRSNKEKLANPPGKTSALSFRRAWSKGSKQISVQLDLQMISLRTADDW